MALRWLYLDMNSFFASCEQQDRPELRGKPVGVVPMMADSTSVLAASYEAKRFGVRTGTKVADAKRMCPGIRFVTGGHKSYVRYHHRVLEAVESCVPIEQVCSIDEVACRLTGTQQDPTAAMKLARHIKQTIAANVGECLTSSIGIAPNRFLAKVAADMQKPNGLTVLPEESLPDALYGLDLDDFPGIGPRMLRRLHRFGIFDVETLCALPPMRMRGIWGGIGGARFYLQLQGQDVEFAATQTKSLSHQHVLEPNLRNWRDGLDVARRLLIKGTERMRSKAFYCKAITVSGKLLRDAGYWVAERRFSETQDTGFLLDCLSQMWQEHPTAPPLRLGVVLHGLVPESAHQMNLFEKKKSEALMRVVDGINKRYGRNTLNFGLRPGIDIKVGRDKIAFQHVPSLYEAG